MDVSINYFCALIFFNFQATCSKQPCLSCAGNPLLTPSSQSGGGGPAAAAAAVAAAASAAETEHRIYLRSHRQRRNQQLLQIQQQQQQQQVANLTLRPWTRSRAQQVLHHYQLEQLHPSHTGILYLIIALTCLPFFLPL